MYAYGLVLNKRIIIFLDMCQQGMVNLGADGLGCRVCKKRTYSLEILWCCELTNDLQTTPSGTILSNINQLMAEGEGFEPPDLSINGFQDRRLKPLGHPSNLRILHMLGQ